MSRVIRLIVSLVITVGLVGFAGRTTQVSAWGNCNYPYFSGHKAYMSCSGTGYAAMTIRCSAFGFWLGGGDRAWTTGRYINGPATLVHDCGWAQWPAQVKSYTPSFY